jgi:hypothetical protein
MKSTPKINNIRGRRKMREDKAIWLDAYDKALAKPQWRSDNMESGKKRHEVYARLQADIAVGDHVALIRGALNSNALD